MPNFFALFLSFTANVSEFAVLRDFFKYTYCQVKEKISLLRRLRILLGSKQLRKLEMEVQMPEQQMR